MLAQTECTLILYQGKYLCGWLPSRWGAQALARVYDDVMFKTLPMPGVKLPDLPDDDAAGDDSDEQDPLPPAVSALADCKLHGICNTHVV